MGAYNTQNPPYALSPGDAQVVLNGSEQINGATPYAGQQIAITPVAATAGTRIRWRGQFVTLGTTTPAAPGAFEVDIQESETDVTADYSNIPGASATAVDANQQFYIDEIDAAAGNFRRPNVKTLTNNVGLILTARRMP